jgi:hypothetical protein
VRTKLPPKKTGEFVSTVAAGRPNRKVRAHADPIRMLSLSAVRIDDWAWTVAKILPILVAIRQILVVVREVWFMMLSHIATSHSLAVRTSRRSEYRRVSGIEQRARGAIFCVALAGTWWGLPTVPTETRSEKKMDGEIYS